ncbi:hypothetical protein [Methylobacterium sp. 37f]|uniref:hypothetical protein n=1 Tax=Methylobacterium sp. 37f TaxID=2817058 RepID=UPI001FFDA152|nr:hypothetical protein [Methylobacterium sp. 37f]MCK2054967.1 hypothetical protein [Methylobacterium sp. 37f]
MTEDRERLYRGMTPEQISAHEDWVRRFKAADAGKAAAAAREAERLDRERGMHVTAMPDEAVLAEAIVIVQRGAGLSAGVIFLREAGFERRG